MSNILIGSTQESKEPSDGSTYSVIFNADGSMNIVADCNTVMASYTTGDAGAITIKLGASTRIACPEGSIADDFLNVLGEASTVSVLSLGDLLLIVIATPDESNVSFTAAK
ncbi:MAG: META domain-containing protein [Chloroflexi bacterium]|nr:META domain-containing protein [Chloroflexota bacterium]